MLTSDYRHPFPPHWHVPSCDNYTSVTLTSGTEFEQVQREFHASLPREAMKLLSVTRYVPMRSLVCRVALRCYHFPLHRGRFMAQGPEPVPVAASPTAT